MSSLAEIEQAAVKLPLHQKQELMRFLGEQLHHENGARAPRHLPPAERAAELKRWVASHERGPGLPASATRRDAIYD